MSDLNILWGQIRVALHDSNYSVSQTRNLVILAGMNPLGLSSEQLRAPLFASMDYQFAEFDGTEKNRFLQLLVEEAVKGRPEFADALKNNLKRHGWQIDKETSKLVPIEILDLRELADLPDKAREGLILAATRLRDGDPSGAIAAAAGAVDKTTQDIYAKYGIGDPDAASFQERVKKSLQAMDVFSELEKELKNLGWDNSDVRLLNKNFEGSLNQASFVLQTLRSKMGDFHGVQPVIMAMVFDSIKWAAIIARLLK